MDSISSCPELEWQHVVITAVLCSPVEGTVETWTETDKSGFKEGYSSAAQLIRLKICSNRGHGIDLLCILITSSSSRDCKTLYMVINTHKIFVSFFPFRPLWRRGLRSIGEWTPQFKLICYLKHNICFLSKFQMLVLCNDKESKRCVRNFSLNTILNTLYVCE